MQLGPQAIPHVHGDMVCCS